ncbi:hypothetical protein D9M72_653120 [compost metagenome]
MVLGTLDGKIEGDLQAVIRGRRHQATKVFAGAQLRVNRLVPALFTADGVRAAWIVGTGGK